MSEPIKELNIDGKTYVVTCFGESVQTALRYREVWVEQLSKERLAVAKTEAAIRQLDSELLAAVNTEIASWETKAE